MAYFFIFLFGVLCAATAAEAITENMTDNNVSNSTLEFSSVMQPGATSSRKRLDPETMSDPSSLPSSFSLAHTGVHGYFEAISFRRHRAMHSEASLADCSGSVDLCAPHGKCVPLIGCVCDNEAQSGFWTGLTCSECDQGWAGSECKDECRGGSCNACNGHGECNEGTNGDGSCTCSFNELAGYWGGADCGTCATNYFGTDCKRSCPGSDNGIPCSGRGICKADANGDGVCACDVGWSPDSGCADCDAAHYGQSCGKACDGIIGLTLPCSGHGRCFNGTTGNGSCVCYPGSDYGTFDCSRQCPNGCSGRGICNEGAQNDATCTCDKYFAPPDCGQCISSRTGAECELICPVNLATSLICSDNGNCTYNPVTSKAFCLCVDGFTGDTCDIACPGNPPCSGHGKCVSGPAGVSCDCSNDMIGGYWAGDVCDRCNVEYNNSVNCNVKCPAGPGGVCSGFGYCMNGICFCQRRSQSADLLDHCGTACELSSVPNQINPQTGLCVLCACQYCENELMWSGDCSKDCPARTINPLSACNTQGLCLQGSSTASGIGGCTCFEGFSGPSCELQCAVDRNGEPCGGFIRGTCSFSTDIFGNSAPYCKCRTGFAGAACNISCPSSGGSLCSGHGVCSDGHLGYGNCTCDKGYTGHGCSVTCDCDVDHGNCDLKVCGKYLSTQICHACVCDEHFIGRCDECEKGWQGRTCDGQCVNGTTVGRSCECFTNFSTASCSVPCPSDENGTICSGHGSCVWGPLEAGSCACDPPGAPTWFGPACNVSCTEEMCRGPPENKVHPQCNPLTGICECSKDPSKGNWGGEFCDQCQIGYWGQKCTDTCQCNDHGACDKNSGNCECFSSDTLGHFAGTTCDTCASGYIGDNCERRNVRITRLPDFTAASGEMEAAPQLEFRNPASPPAINFLMADPRRERLYVGGVPVFQYNSSGYDLVEISTSSTFFPTTGGNKTQLCKPEVYTAWVHDNDLFFLMQPNPTPSCLMRVRVVKSTRLATAMDFNSMPVTWQWPVENYTVRIVAAATLGRTDIVGEGTSEAVTPVVAFALAQFSDVGGQGVQWPGGYLVHVDDLALTPVMAMYEITEPFIPTTMALWEHQRKADPADQDPETIAIGGNTLDNWDIWVVFVEKGRFLPATDPASPTMSIRGFTPCWPQAGVSTVSTITTCVDCRQVDRISFFGGSIVAAMHTKNDFFEVYTFLAWITPIHKVDDGEIVWARVPASSQACRKAKYDTAFRELSAVDDPNQPAESQLPKYVISVARVEDEGSRATSLTVDDEGKIAYLCLNRASVGEGSLLVKFTLEVGNFAVHGRLKLGNVFSRDKGTAIPEVFQHMEVDPRKRLLFCITGGISNVRIVTILLYEVHSVTPDVADERGSTKILVRGLGFKPQVKFRSTELEFPVKCRFGEKDAVDALDTEAFPITFYSMTCIITAIDNQTTSIGSCGGQTVEVSLFGDSPLWTSNLIAVKRVQAARIEAVSPDRGPEQGYVPGTNIPWAITIRGQGFVDSIYSRCMFYSLNPAMKNDPPLISSLVFKNPNLAVCTQPSSNKASKAPSFVSVLTDGQLFSEAGTAAYEIVGAPSNLSSPASYRVTAAAQIEISGELRVVDLEGHALESLDTVPRWVCVDPNIHQDFCDPALFAWRNLEDGFPWPPCRNNTLNISQLNATSAPSSVDKNFSTCEQTVLGRARFSPLYFDNPRSGTMILTMFSPDFGWFSQTTFIVVSGDAYALAVRNSVEMIGKPILPGGPVTPGPEVITVDSLGNPLELLPPTITIIGQPFFVMDKDEKVTRGTPIILPASPEDGGSLRFSRILPMFVHGAAHFINFTSENPRLNGVISPELRTQLCSHEKFKVPGSDACESCPPEGAICNGTELIIVVAGYWRGNTSTEIYPCPGGKAICLGSNAPEGSECAEGYQGPLCQDCITGWGHVGLVNCQVCPDISTSVTYIAVAGFFGLIFLLTWVTMTLRTPEVTDLTVVVRTVVNHMQATGKLGEFSSEWDPFLKGVFNIQESASSFSVAGLSSLDCVLRHTGRDFSAVFAGYMLLPVMAVVMAFGVFVVVRALKLKPVISKELEEEIKEDIKTMGNPRTAILLQRYPFSMVVTTTLCVTLFAMYQMLIEQSTVVLQCKELITRTGTTELFLEVDMRIKCDANGDHFFRTYALVCAVGYGLGVPGVFLFGHFFMTGRIGRPALTRQMFMFLIGGYQHKFWFWQAIIMVRKLFLVLSIVFIQQNKQLQSYAGVWTMSFALILQIWFQPNSKKEFNDVEAMSLSIITITLNLGLLYFWPELPDFGRDILTAVLILITIGVLVGFGYFIYGPAKQQFSQQATKLLESAKTAVETARNKLNKKEEKKNIRWSKADEDNDDYSGESEMETTGTGTGPKPTNKPFRTIVKQTDRSITLDEAAFDEFDDLPPPPRVPRREDALEWDDL